MNMINNSDMLTLSMMRQSDVKHFGTDPLYDLQRNRICDNNIDPLNISPSINLSNKLNPNNVHYDIQLAERFFLYLLTNYNYKYKSYYVKF